MKKYLSYVVCLAALLFSSCIKDNIVDNPSRDVVLSFTISNGDTRANGDGASIGTNDDLYNEDAIKNVDIFLYPATATDATPATKHLALSFEDTREKCTIQETLSNNELTALGLNANGAKCKAYIVVNYPEVATQAASTSVTDLQSTVVSTDFSQTQPYDTKRFGSDPTSTVKITAVKPQDKFVMDSEVVELSFDNANKVLGSTTSIPVTRVAAKIRLTVSLADKIFTGNQGTGGLIWFPNVEGMNVAFYNGVKSATVHKIEDPEDRTDKDNKADFFNVQGIQFLTQDLQGGTGAGFVGGDSAEGSAYVPTRATVSDVTHVTPFYTYPSAWTADLDKDDAARFELVVRWYSVPNSDEYYDENGEFQDPGYIGDPSTAIEYHYSIPINMVDKKIERNKYYNIKLNIGVLGNLDTFDPSVYSYTVDDWYSEDINVELTKPQYLTVEKNYVEMNNVDSYSVGYQASDNITASIIKVQYPNLMNGQTITAYDNATGTDTVEGFTVSRNEDTNFVTLHHALDNDRSDGEYDYFPYTVTVLVSMDLGGNKKITEEIVFKQYPAIYVDADRNTDYDDNSSSGSWWGSDDTSDNDGYVFINAGTGYGGVSGLAGNNQNPSMYIISVSALDTDEYIIGDPRSTSISNPTGSTTAPALYPNTNRRNLMYYYPTAPVSDKVIAPKFRIASSYGKTNTLSYDNALRRCAFYQEDGYPAGRWRIPTPAEIKFMVQFANEGKIEVLLSPDTYYWSGYNKTAYQYNTRTDKVEPSTSGSAYVRCVYDEWYWGSEKACDIETFTWGDDQPR